MNEVHQTGEEKEQRRVVLADPANRLVRPN
jgi:hypothetical protein